MTNPANKDLLLAILAMDSYNQGYKPGLAHGSKTIGSATFKDPENTVTNAWQAAGFYAAEYSTPFGTVISYRGTDVLDPFAEGNDILNGWVIGAGTQTGQSVMALDFYGSVTGTPVFDGPQDDVILTGHSLGGGLAGMVSWLSGTEAVVFDNMPFGLASSIIAAQSSDFEADIIRRPQTGAVRAEYVVNEILQSVRSGTLVAALALLGAPPGSR